jgi:hypothetical protein
MGDLNLLNIILCIRSYIYFGEQCMAIMTFLFIYKWICDRDKNVTWGIGSNYWFLINWLIKIDSILNIKLLVILYSFFLFYDGILYCMLLWKSLPKYVQIHWMIITVSYAGIIHLLECIGNNFLKHALYYM